jgi:hypothetical protein
MGNGKAAASHGRDNAPDQSDDSGDWEAIRRSRGR